MKGFKEDMKRLAGVPDGFAVFAADDNFSEEAAALAERFGVSTIRNAEEADRRELVMRIDGSGLSLTGGRLVLRGDLTGMIQRIKRNNLGSELLVKAAKLKNAPLHPLAVDATAGLGEDSLLLAAAGFHVRMYEYDPVIAALLRDSLRRAAAVPELSDAVSRMELFECDSITAMRRAAEETDGKRPDVVLLDPMFPERRKSALVKKKFQLLHLIERPCADGEELLAAAEASGPFKIIIKRPLKGEYLAGRKPDYSLRGKAVRYDCIVLPRT